MIDKIDKNVIRYSIEHRLRYVNKNVNNATSLQKIGTDFIDTQKT